MDGHGLDVGRVASFLQTLCTDLSSLVECTFLIPRDTLEAFESGLELVYRELLAYEMIAGDNVTRRQSEAIDCVGAAVHVLRGGRNSCAGVQNSRDLCFSKGKTTFDGGPWAIGVTD